MSSEERAFRLIASLDWRRDKQTPSPLRDREAIVGYNKSGFIRICYFYGGGSPSHLYRANIIKRLVKPSSAARKTSKRFAQIVETYILLGESL